MNKIHKVAPIIRAIFKKKLSQNEKLIKNMKNYEQEKKIKQQESEILEQRATERAKSQRKTTIRNYR